MKAIHAAIFIAVAIIFLYGCSTLKSTKINPSQLPEQTLQKPTATHVQMIDQEKSEWLATAVASWNREKLDSLIEENDALDPVLLIAEGNFLLHEGNSEDGAKLLLEALSLVNENQFVCSHTFVRMQAQPDQSKNDGSEVILSEDKQIIQSVRDAYLQKTSNAEVLQIMAMRTGAIPYPPTFRGTMGLAFEIISQHTKKNYFLYRFASYPVVKNDTVRGVEILRKTIAINLIITGLLSDNTEVLQSGVTVLQGVKKPDSEASFFIGLANYFLGNEDYVKYFDYKTKQLFATL